MPLGTGLDTAGVTTTGAFPERETGRWPQCGAPCRPGRIPPGRVDWDITHIKQGDDRARGLE